MKRGETAEHLDGEKGQTHMELAKKKITEIKSRNSS